jgi:hypothetical protein
VGDRPDVAPLFDSPGDSHKLGTNDAPDSHSGHKKNTNVPDIYGGRLGLAKADLLAPIRNPLGNGFRIPGKDHEGRGLDVSSSAILMWLVYTGFVGLLLIMLRDLQVVIASLKAALDSPLIVTLFQAWAALWVQNVFYGTWMTPVFFLTVAFIFTAIYHTANPAGNSWPYKNLTEAS